MDNIFSSQFWSTNSGRFVDWVVEELPGIIILTILILILLKIASFSLKKIKKTLLSRAEKDPKTDASESEKRLNTLFGILNGLVKIVLYTILILGIVKKFGVDIGPILASAGIIGLAVGFGAQELVRDFISGFFMLLENQVRTGDVAVINGTGGLVEKIELRTITLRDFSGTVHIFQNGKISTLSNMTKEWSAMVFNIGVAYKEDLNKVMQIMKQVGQQMEIDPDWKENIIEPIEVFGLEEFGDSALVIRARIKTKPIQQWNIGREYRKRLKYEFDKENIEIPFPHTTIYWGDEINPLKLNMDQGSKS